MESFVNCWAVALLISTTTFHQGQYSMLLVRSASLLLDVFPGLANLAIRRIPSQSTCKPDCYFSVGFKDIMGKRNCHQMVRKRTNEAKPSKLIKIAQTAKQHGSSEKPRKPRFFKIWVRSEQKKESRRKLIEENDPRFFETNGKSKFNWLQRWILFGPWDWGISVYNKGK